MADFEQSNGPVRLKVEGLSKTIRDLSRAGAATDDLKDLMKSIGQIVVNATRPPQLTGQLADTPRAGRGKTKSVVRAGGARAPYAGVIEYGWPARGIAAQPYLTPALNDNRAKILNALDEGIQDLLRKSDLL